MASQLGSNETKRLTARDWHPVVPALIFVLATYAFNLGLNTALFRLQPVLPGVPQRAIVAAPLTLLGAGALLGISGIAMTYSLSLFVHAAAESTGHTTSATSSAVGVGQFARVAGVVVGGGIATALGFALLVVPGFVVLAHIPFVLVAVVLENQSIEQAIKIGHARVRTDPVPVAAVTLLAALGLAAVTAVGVYTSLVPPAIEVGVGAAGTAVVLLVGVYAFTGLYRRGARRHGGI
ncbi:uncharacterized protein Nmlp_2858 [Natronomonas moolapensis 8.8.11]|uniref:Uncharacterized protein n=1 Tax=Natronomonas moolapensis (strain DSM 18674 / CECT 7526 / JCM 14361 / 8.8.11) TaxID=268739 RepID=M1Y3C2_NATM8|nr:hypothetical protein [Natronomonas moolapensis]CCQ37008.1 uncharacterized protein Nmlp_2858 [Natronomonas moolapensis 8.8.11]